MSDIDVSKSHVSDDSKKRKVKEASDVDGERRKKRKRTPHSAKKNKDKDNESEVQPETNLIPTDPINDENLPTGDKSQSNKKESHDVAEVEEGDSNITQTKDKVAKKKEKTKKSLPHLDPVSNPPTAEAEPEKASDTKSNKKEKEKKNKYPDPRKDSALSESETALKALTYVYERLTSHSEWKFNKARQNWILRNIWDENAIPEVYALSCVKYLKGVQGNSRNVLIIECNSIIEEHSKSEPAKTEGTVRFQEPSPSEPKAKNEIKYSRAQAILKKLTK